MAKKKVKGETAEILEIVNFIKDHMVENMATKEDVVRIEKRLFSIEQELKDIKRRLAKLEDNYDAVRKYGAEIKALQGRVKALEKQLATRH
ncbi:MAG: hypothetical protein Q8P19_01035 [bacterium]|nr:hypothetical protein [bacterium]